MPALRVRTHTATSNKSSNTTGLVITLATGGALSGRVLIAAMTFDNVTNASTPTVSSIGKQSGESNNWVQIASADSSTSTGASGCRTEIWAIQTSVAWSAGNYTVTLSGAVTAKAAHCIEMEGVTVSLRGTAGSGTSTSSAPSASSSGTAPVAGDVAIGAAGFEHNNSGTVTGDSDSTSGNWSTALTSNTTGGNAFTNVTLVMQYKILTGTSAQTYNPTYSTSTDSNACVAVLQAATYTATSEYEDFEGGTDGADVTTSNTDFDVITATAPDFSTVTPSGSGLGMRVTKGATSTAINARFNLADASRVVYTECLVRFDAFNDNTLVMGTGSITADEANVWLVVSTGNRIQLDVRGSTTNSANTYSTGVWYRLRLQYIAPDPLLPSNDYDIALSIYSGANLFGGTPDETITRTTANTLSDAAHRVFFGCGTTSVACDIYYDNCRVSTTPFVDPAFPATVAATAKVAGPRHDALTTIKPTGSTGRFTLWAWDDAGQVGVMVGENGSTILTTTDGGDTWASRTIAASAVIFGVAYGNGYFVASGNSGGTNYCYYTTDPTSVPWTTLTFSASLGTTPRVAYGNGWWLIVGADRSAYINGNPNGSWTETTTLFGGGNPGTPNHLVYMNNQFVLACGTSSFSWYTGNNPSTGWASTNGGSTSGAFRINYNGTHWVIGGMDGVVYYTSTMSGSAWSTITPPGSWGVVQTVQAVMWDRNTGRWWVAQLGDSSTGQEAAWATTPSGTWTRVIDPWDSTSTNVGTFEYVPQAFDAAGLNGGFVVWNLNPMPTRVRTSSTVSVSVVAGTTTIGAPTVTTGGGTDATATPSTVAAVATVGAPTASGTALAIPATVAAVATIGAPTPTSSATTTPATVAGTASIGTPTFTSAVVVTPATVAGTASIGAPTLSTSSTASPGTVAGSTTIAATAQTGSTVTPATVAAVATIGTPTFQSDANPNPTTVAASATVDAPVLAAGSVVVVATVTCGSTAGTSHVSPSWAGTVAGVTTISTPTVSGASNATPATVATITAVDSPTFTSSVTITPTTVAGAAIVEAPTVAVSDSATATPNTVTAVTNVGAPQFVSDVAVTPAIVAAVATVGAPTLAAGAVVVASTVGCGTTVGTSHVSPSWAGTVTATTTIGAPTLQASVTITTVTVDAVATVGAPNFVSDVLTTPTTVLATATVGTPAFTSSATGTPTVVAGTTAVGVPTFTSDATASLTTVSAVTTVDAPTFISDVNVLATTVASSADIPAPASLSSSVSAATVHAVTTVGSPAIDSNAPVATVFGVTTVGAIVFTSDVLVTGVTVSAVTAVGTPVFFSSASITPSTVEASTAVGTGNVQPAQAATVHAVATVGVPSIQTSGNVNVVVDTVAAVATVGALTIAAGATVTPATVAIAATVGAPTFTSDVQVTPDTVSATAAVDAVTAAAGATVGAITVDGSTSIATPGVTLVAGVATVAAVASVDAPTVLASSTVAAATVEASAAVGTPTFAAGAVVTPATVAASAQVPAPNITLVAEVVTVHGATTIDTPSVTAGNSVNISATTVHAVTSADAVTVQASSSATVTPNTVHLATSVPTPTSAAGTTATPATVHGSTFIGSTQPTGPHVVIGQVTISAGSTTSAATVTVTATIAAPTLAVGATSSPATVPVTITVAVPAIFAGSTATVGTVDGVTTVGGVSIAGAALIAAAVVEAVTTLDNVTVTTARTPFWGWGVPIR